MPDDLDRRTGHAHLDGRSAAGKDRRPAVAPSIAAVKRPLMRVVALDQPPRVEQRAQIRARQVVGDRRRVPVGRPAAAGASPRRGTRSTLTGATLVAAGTALEHDERRARPPRRTAPAPTPGAPRPRRRTSRARSRARAWPAPSEASMNRLPARLLQPPAGPDRQLRAASPSRPGGTPPARRGGPRVGAERRDHRTRSASPTRTSPPEVVMSSRRSSRTPDLDALGRVRRAHGHPDRTGISLSPAAAGRSCSRTRPATPAARR